MEIKCSGHTDYTKVKYSFVANEVDMALMLFVNGVTSLSSYNCIQRANSKPLNCFNEGAIFFKTANPSIVRGRHGHCSQSS